MLSGSAFRVVSTRSRHAVASSFILAVTGMRHASNVRGPSSRADGGRSAARVVSAHSSVASSSASITDAGSSQEPRVSRFNRTSAPHGKTELGAANLGGAAENTAASNGVPSEEMFVRQVTAPAELRSQRMLIAYLQRVQNALRQTRLPAVDAHARLELCRIFLPAIRGLDPSSVALLLQTLRAVDVEGSSPVVGDAAAWLSLYGHRLAIAQFIKVIELLHHFEAPLATDFVQTLPQRLSTQDVAALTVAQCVSLLTAVLPCVKHPAVGATDDEEAVKRASASSTAAELAALAGALRERCKGAEFVAVDVSLLAQLLRALLTFRTSRMWRQAAEEADAAAWLSLEEAMCFILASVSQSDRMTLTTATQLLAALVDAARHPELTSVAADSATSVAEARLASALVKRLEAAAGALAEPTPSSRLLDDEGVATTHGAAELPWPWCSSDVRAVWAATRQGSSEGNAAATTTATASVDLGNEENTTTSLAAKAMALLQCSLLTSVSALFAAHHGDKGLAEMAFRMACDIAEAERTAAKRARALLPESKEWSLGAASSTPASETAQSSDLASILPLNLLEAVLSSSAEQLQAAGGVTWTPATVRDAVTLLQHSSDATHRDRAAQLAQAWYKQLQARAQSGTRITPQELLAFFTPELLRRERLGVDAAVEASLRRWSVSEVLFFFAQLATMDDHNGGFEGATVLRSAGAALCVYAAKASAAQLGSLVECYGVARVRNDEFCEAAVTRLAELLNENLLSATRDVAFSTVGVARSGGAAAADANGSETRGVDESVGGGSSGETRQSPPPVGLAQLAQLLRAFALLEVRTTKPFLDAAPYVVQAVNEDRGSAAEVTQLLAAYAKMLIWNYPVFRALAERLCRIDREDVTLQQLVTAQLALLRMDVTLPHVTVRFYEELTKHYGVGSDQDARAAPDRTLAEAERPMSSTLTEVVMHLSVFSRLRGRSDVPLPDVRVSAGMIQHILKQAEVLRVEEVAEVLLSLARIGEGSSEAFGQLATRTLGLLPTAPPRVMAHIVEAYAQAGRSDAVELFTLVAERTIAMRHEMAAVTIASILASFAKAGMRNDRLFIEVIPRVRHVGTYGTPRDVVNVVSAYAAVNLWHYKLFSRLADRAVQLRADFRVPELVQLLRAYATVQMRYDTLFTEFAPRIQTLAHLLTASDLAAIVSSYNRVNIPCLPVWKATAARAVVVVEDFTEEEAEQLLNAYSTQGFYNEECVGALISRFPSLSRIPFEESETNDGEAEERKR